jgi:thymidylate synthase (FAD)
VIPLQHTGGDEFALAAARVSSQGIEALESLDPEHAAKARGTINALMRQRHGSPFEHGYATFYVHAPLFIWEEIKRHRHMPFDHDDLSLSQESARYKEIEPTFWIPERSRPMLVPDEYKAMRPRFLETDDGTYETVRYELTYAYSIAYDAYRNMIERNVAREVARAALPHGIYASGWVSGNPRALLNFISLRTHDEQATYVSYPQAEIEDIARQIEEFLAQHWPVTYETFQKNGRVAP